MSSSDEADLLPDITFTDELAASQSDSAKETETQNSSRLDELKRKFKENEEYLERKRKIDEVLKEEELERQRQKNNIVNENIELDPSQKSLLQKIALNTDAFIDLKPSMDSYFDLEHFNPSLYEYPVECYSNDYKHFVGQFIDDLSAQKLSDYAIHLTDYFKFKNFFKQIPTVDLKKYVLDCFILNSLTIISQFMYHNICSIIEKIGTTYDLTCREWYFSGLLLFKFVSSMGLKKDKFDAFFPNQIEKLTSRNLEYLEKLDKRSKQSNNQLNKECLDMVVLTVIKLLRSSITKKPQHYDQDEIELIFYLLCIFILDKHFQSDFELIIEFNFVFIELFRDRANVENMVASLTNLIRYEVDDDTELDEKRILEINTRFHRLIFLLNTVNMRKESENFKTLSTKMAFICLQEILVVFANLSFEEKWNESKIDVMIESLEQHAKDVFTASSYAMSNILLLLSIIFDCYFPSLEDKNEVLKYFEKLKILLWQTNRYVRDQMGFNGRAQVKALLSHYIYLSELYIEKYCGPTALLPSPHSSGIKIRRIKENKENQS